MDEEFFAFHFKSFWHFSKYGDLHVHWEPPNLYQVGNCKRRPSPGRPGIGKGLRHLMAGRIKIRAHELLVCVGFVKTPGSPGLRNTESSFNNVVTDSEWGASWSLTVDPIGTVWFFGGDFGSLILEFWFWILDLGFWALDFGVLIDLVMFGGFFLGVGAGGQWQ